MSSEEVANYAGVTLRQLQFWDESGIVKPGRVKGARVFSEHQAMELRVLSEFRRKGLSLQKLRPLVPFIRNRLKVAKPGQHVGIWGRKVVLLLNNGEIEKVAKSATLTRALVVARV